MISSDVVFLGSKETGIGVKKNEYDAPRKSVNGSSNTRKLE